VLGSQPQSSICDNLADQNCVVWRQSAWVFPWFVCTAAVLGPRLVARTCLVQMFTR
jgi:hypothetical protein